MVNFMNSMAEQWWSWQFSMLWQTAVLIGIVWIVDLCIRKWAHPQVRYALWMLVLIKLLIPPTWTSPASVTSHIPDLTLRAATVMERAESSPPAKGEYPAGGRGLITPASQETAASTEPPLNHPGLTATPPSKGGELNANSSPPLEGGVPRSGEGVIGSRENLHWKTNAMLAWLAGMVLLATWLVIRLTGLRREHLSTSACHPGPRAGIQGGTVWMPDQARHDNSGGLPERFYAQLESVAAKLGLKRLPRVILTDKVACPAVFGVFRPVLLMPAKKFKTMTRKDTEHILLHELAHIKRGDLVVHAVWMLVQIVYWFNPLLWMIRRTLQNLRELCCDATVARLLRDKTCHYRETLLETARQLLAEPVDPGLGLLGLFENNNWLVTRLQWLEKNTWKNRPLRIATIILLVSVMAACVLPMANRPKGGIPVPKGGLYENAKGSKNHKIKVGPTKFEVHTVVRYEQNGNPIIKNPDGSEKRVIDMETPDFSGQTKWMDIAQVYLSPEQTKYDVIELRLFDHATRKFLDTEDYPGIGYRIEDSVVTVYSTGKMLPDSLDIWMRVLHKPNDKEVYLVQPTKNSTANIDGNTLRLLYIAKGLDHWTNGKRTQHQSQWDATVTSFEMKFDKLGDKQYQICAVSKDGRRVVPDFPHFFRPSNGWFHAEVELPMDQIKHFELRPFKGRDRFFIDNVKLPRRAGRLDTVPMMRFETDGQGGEHKKQVGSLCDVKLTISPKSILSGVSSGSSKRGNAYRVETSAENLTTLVCQMNGIGIKDVTFVGYDKEGNYVDLFKTIRRGGAGGIVNPLKYITTEVPAEKIHTVDVYFDKIADSEIPSRINPEISTQNSKLQTNNYTATLPNGVTVEIPLPVLTAHRYYKAGEPIQIEMKQLVGDDWKPTLEDISKDIDINDGNPMYVMVNGKEYQSRSGIGPFGGERPGLHRLT